MNNWLVTATKNLIPLSSATELDVALKEWLYTGDMHDLGQPCVDCELCEHPGLRYQFKIVNTLTNKQLLVGSECITKFTIRAVDDEGNLLDEESSKKKVIRDKQHLINEAKKKRLINTLVELAGLDNEFDIESFINYVQDNGAFTPNQLSLLIWRLDKHSINYVKSDLKLTIRKSKDKKQLLTIPDWKVDKLWDCLSRSQQQWYLDNK